MIRDMEAYFARGALQHAGWGQKKAALLARAWTVEPWGSILDVGVGRHEHWDKFTPFQRREFRYTGVEGCPSIADAFQAAHPDLTLHRLLFSMLVSSDMRGSDYDAVAMLDVLYHVPSDDLHADMLDFAFAARRTVLLTHSTTECANRGTVPGQDGFDWFPRAFTSPPGWSLVERVDSGPGDGFPQSLYWFRRG
ncbi:MAG: hypothetical protein L0Y64_22255 [Myxococcaceae bacterium]|nr:hypothetical protein [Myxococcaceae bacterium]